VQLLCNQNSDGYHVDVRPSRALTMERLADLRSFEVPIKFSPVENLVGIYIVPSGNTRHGGPGHKCLFNDLSPLFDAVTPELLLGAFTVLVLVPVCPRSAPWTHLKT
jgi:hypothetical protein